MMPVIILFFTLLITESITSKFIASLHLNAEYYWFEAAANASILALISLVILRFIFTYYRQIQPSGKVREWLFLQVGLSVFGIELSLALLQSIISLEHLNNILLFDFKSLAFASVSSIAIYIYVFYPYANTLTSFLNRIEIRYSTSYLFGLSLLLLFLINVFQTQSEDLKEKIIKNEADQLVLIDKALTYRIAEAVLDTRTLASQPDFVRHLSGNENAVTEVQLEFRNIVDIKHSYDQIRFIDEKGREQVRINKGQQRTEIVPEQDLQNKINRYYVPETGKLDHGKVYISPLDLNIEHGQIEIPHKPITRIATPVKDPLQNLMGLIVINLNASHLIQHLDDAQSLSQGKIMMLNQDGYWLHGESKEKLWAFMYEDNQQPPLPVLNPELWQALSDKHIGSLEQKNGYYVFHRVLLSQDQRIEQFEQNAGDWPQWLLITYIDKQLVAQKSLERLNLMIIISALLALVTGIGTYLYTRSQLKRTNAENKIRHMAEHDPLTGLYNRRHFMQELEQSLHQARKEKTSLALFYLDLDNFKPINDDLGHEAGDEALMLVSHRLSQMLRQNDTLARIGGDEFVLMIHNPQNQNQLEEIANRIIDNLKHPLSLKGAQCQLGVSIGIAVSRHNNESRDELLKAADMLMLEAKAKGKSCFCIGELDNLSNHYQDAHRQVAS
ncbi:diguanylate cyclase domain-containing protein [Neptuniibacter sp. PT8_73]|uniref:diguanylate cyclase domain-containing protein n=1 Tax=unclassified Neptuniibacter TaxID=2630693 RepID=UPI0039F69ABC